MSADTETLILTQQNTCKTHGLAEVAPEEMVAVAISSLGKMPIYGARIVVPEGGHISWFIHCGEYSDAIDFYKPLHIQHLEQMLPSVLKYLRLPPGAKFIIDDAGYEDVWFDSEG